jgi:PAS domain S-box-containing protein
MPTPTQNSRIMTTHNWADRRFRSARLLFFAGSALIVVILTAASLAIWQLHDDRIADEMKDAQNLSIVLAEQTARTIQAVDLVVQETHAMIVGAGVANAGQFKEQMNTAEVNQFLVSRLHSLPQANAIALVDNAGMIINSSRAWPASFIDVSKGEIYEYFRDHDDPGAFIGRPIVSKVTGAWEIIISRRVSGSNGEFLGIVVGVVELKYFEDFYRAISIDAGESVSLFRRDGTLLVRYPRVEKMIGQPISTKSPWYQAVANGGGTYRSPGYLDNIPRIVSVQAMRDYPLAVTMTTSEVEALAPWRRQSTLIAIGAAGAVVGFAILFRALATQFGRIEQHSSELAQSEARFRDFAQTSSDWFWETDELHRFTFISEGVRDFGQDPSSRIGRHRVELATDSGSDPAKWQAHLATLNRHEPFRDFVYTRKVGPQPENIISISGGPYLDPSGRFLGYRGTGRDITEQVHAERALHHAKDGAEAANLAKSQFLANMSHELRTPLNAIIGFSEMMERGLAGPIGLKQLEYAGLVHKSGEHLLNIINDILDLARVDSGKFELRDENDVDPRSIIDACVSLLRERATAGLLTLTTDISPRVPLLVADPTRLKQILLNVLSNAVKFTEPGGSVVVALRHEPDGSVSFAVSDTGPGMTPDEIVTALEPFGQVDDSHTRRHEGTGLGLPLARRLAALHGGSLGIQSEKGAGTTVTVTLPVTRVLAREIATGR